MPTDIQEIAHNLATQDNRITDQPIFIVQQLRKVYSSDESDEYDWVHTDDWDDVDDTELVKELEAYFKEHGEAKEGYTQNFYVKIWEFVTACFTEQGCKDYIAANGHNLKEPRIYAAGSYRNKEWQAVRNFLLSQQQKDTNAPTL